LKERVTMAVVQVAHAPSRELYEQVTKLLEIPSTPMAGLIVHAAAELPSGEVQIVDVYESAEALNAFTEERLMPAFAQAGVLEVAMERGRPDSYEVFNLIH
jgi:hypothetical protein